MLYITLVCLDPKYRLVTIHQTSAHHGVLWRWSGQWPTIHDGTQHISSAGGKPKKCSIINTVYTILRSHTFSFSWVFLINHSVCFHQVCERLGLLYSEMIFCRGYVHSDPHPGNVLVSKMPTGDAQIILLDHGLYAVSTVTVPLARWELQHLQAVELCNTELIK